MESADLRVPRYTYYASPNSLPIQSTTIFLVLIVLVGIDANPIRRMAYTAPLIPESGTMLYHGVSLGFGSSDHVEIIVYRNVEILG